MNTILAIVLVCVVIATFAINNARVLRLEEHLQEIEKNMATINSISGEAIDAFGKFVEAIQAASDAAKAATTTEQQKPEDNA